MSGIILLLLWPWMALWNGWALSIAWGWFIVPTFGAPALGVWSAAGVALLASYLTHQHAPDLPCDKRGEWEKFGYAITFAAIKPPLLLGCGWIISRFM